MRPSPFVLPVPLGGAANGQLRRYRVLVVTLGCTEFRMAVMQKNGPSTKICDTNCPAFPHLPRSNHHGGEEAS
jgi:hypothetical protein